MTTPLSADHTCRHWFICGGIGDGETGIGSGSSSTQITLFLENCLIRALISSSSSDSLASFCGDLGCLRGTSGNDVDDEDDFANSGSDDRTIKAWGGVVTKRRSVPLLMALTGSGGSGGESGVLKLSATAGVCISIIFR